MKKIKPKEAYLNVPIVLLFDTVEQIANFACNINTILHGKIRMKYDELGILGTQYVGIFYLQRNDEFQELHDEFVRLIRVQEEAEYNKK